MRSKVKVTARPYMVKKVEAFRVPSGLVPEVSVLSAVAIY